DTSTGMGSQATPAALVLAGAFGSSRDSLNNQTTFTLDRFGYVLTTTDAQGSTTIYERDDDGLVTKRIDPDPDGPGPLEAPITLFSYDSRGNLLSVTHPDGSTESWTYDATFSQVTSHTDPLGNVTMFSIDPVTGRVVDVTEGYGAIDASTSYTYTSAPIGASDPPAGLVA